MKIHPPFIIGSRLLPTLPIGNGSISIERIGRTKEGRDLFRYYIDTPNHEETDDIKSGRQGSTIQAAFRALLSFLEASADSYRPTSDPRNNRDSGLFDAAIEEWAHQFADEIFAARFDIDVDGLIEE